MLVNVLILVAVVIVGAIGLHEAPWWVEEARRRVHAARRKGWLL